MKMQKTNTETDVSIVDNVLIYFVSEYLYIGVSHVNSQRDQQMGHRLLKMS